MNNRLFGYFLRIFGALLLLVALGSVSYWQLPDARQVVDARMPWVKETIIRWGIISEHIEEQEKPVAVAPIAEPTPRATLIKQQVIATIESTPEMIKMPIATVDMEQLSHSPIEWPKVLLLKKDVDFPAVLDGKIIGTVHVPPGTQAKLLYIANGRLALEYFGGRGMFAPEDTDIAERVLLTRKATNEEIAKNQAVAKVSPSPNNILYAAIPESAPPTARRQATSVFGSLEPPSHNEETTPIVASPQPAPGQNTLNTDSKPASGTTPASLAASTTSPIAGSITPAFVTNTFPSVDAPKFLPPLPNKTVERPFTVKVVEFTLKTQIEGNPEVKFQALVPYNKDGTVPKSAENVVLFAPFLTFSGLRYKGTGATYDSNVFLWDLAEIYGMTVFAPIFKVKIEDVDDRRKCYYYPESGSFKAVFEARDKLLRDLHLPKRKLLVIGNSGGSSMAQRLALLYPSETEAVAMIGGGRYDEVDHAVSIPWLVLNTRGDPRTAENVLFVNEARGFGMNVLYAETSTYATRKDEYQEQDSSNFHHTADELAHTLAQQFIIDNCELRGESDEMIMPFNWPLTSLAIDPFQITVNKNTMFVSNLYQQRLFFPSERFAALWQRIPYRHYNIVTPAIPNSHLDIMVCYPETATPKGIVVVDGGDVSDNAKGDMMEYLALQGFITVTAPFSKAESIRLEETQALLKWTLDQDTFSSQSIFLFGIGTGGRHMILAACNISNSRITGVAAIDAPLDWPLLDLSPIAAIKGLRAPLLLLSDSTFYSSDISRESFVNAAKMFGKHVEVSSPTDPESQLAYFDWLDDSIRFFAR